MNRLIVFDDEIHYAHGSCAQNKYWSFFLFTILKFQSIREIHVDFKIISLCPFLHFGTIEGVLDDTRAYPRPTFDHDQSACKRDLLLFQKCVVKILAHCMLEPFCTRDRFCLPDTYSFDLRLYQALSCLTFRVTTYLRNCFRTCFPHPNVKR